MTETIIAFVWAIGFVVMVIVVGCVCAVRYTTSSAGVRGWEREMTWLRKVLGLKK